MKLRVFSGREPCPAVHQVNWEYTEVKHRIDVAPSDPGRALRATHLVQREPIDRVVAIGLRNPWLGDLYHHLLTSPWAAFLLGLAVVYLGC